MKFIYFVVVFTIIFCPKLFSDGVQPSGSGIENNPYEIISVENLLWVSTNSDSWDKYFKQSTNIDISTTQEWNNGEGFSPIGNTDIFPFSGSYDGHNFSIDGLFINRPTVSFQGLFGFVEGDSINVAVICNLNLNNIEIIGSGFVGGIIGGSSKAYINNCHINGNVTGNYKTGVLIGSNTNESIVNNCSSSGEIYGFQLVGGLVGANAIFSEIINSHSSANVDGLYSTGAFIGDNLAAAMISNCYSTGNVSGERRVGGFVGNNLMSASIESCFCIGNVIGDENVGGFVGENIGEGVISNNYSSSNVTGNVSIGGFAGENTSNSIINSCFSIGEVSGNEDVGGLVGYNNNSIVANSFWDIQTSFQTLSAGGSGKTTAEMLNVATFTDISSIGLDTPWDFYNNPFDDINFSDYWDINESFNEGYPFLRWQLELTDSNQDFITINNVLSLKNAYPNPFNPCTRIDFCIQNGFKAKLSIFNIKGQLILFKNFNSGSHSYLWEGKNISSGIYFYRIKSDKFSITKKMLLMK